MNFPHPAYPVGTLIECPAALKEPRPPLAKRMCPRCSLVQGWRVVPPAAAGAILHAICVACEGILAEERAAAAVMAAEYSADIPSPTADRELGY